MNRDSGLLPFLISATLVLFFISFCPQDVFAQLQQGSSAPGVVTTEGSARNADGSAPGPGAAPKTIFLKGQVLVDDDNWEQASSLRPVIEAECGSVRASTPSESNGTWTLSVDMLSRGNRNQNTASGADDFGMRATPTRAGFTTCNIRGVLQGYTSNVLEVQRAENVDPRGAGTIILTRLGAAKRNDGTVSVTTLKAPKNARKEYETGVDRAQKGKLDEADSHLKKALEIYPEYAIAWVALGDVQDRMHKVEDARQSYLKATAADTKFAFPFLRLAGLAAREQKWKDVVLYSEAASGVDPLQFPQAYFFSAVAHMNLQQYDKAEAQASHGIAVDKMEREPRLRLVLAQVAYQLHKPELEAQQLQYYLRLAPNAADAPRLRARLAELQPQGPKATSTQR